MSTFYGNFATHAARVSEEIVPVLEITLHDGGWNSGSNLYLSSGVTIARGRTYDVRIPKAGWTGVTRFFDTRSSNLARLETSVTVADTDHLIRTALETGYQRGSPAVIYWVIPGNTADYAVRFTGVLDTWSYTPGLATLNLRTDDWALRGYLPNYQIMKAEFPGVPTLSLGLQCPLIYGTCNSSGLTSTGQVKCIPINWVSTTTGWYLICLGQAKEVKAVYVAGVEKTITTHYTVEYNHTVSGKVFTVIKFTAGNIPTEDNTVTADVSGYEDTGNTGTGTTAPTGRLYTNPVEQMRHLLVNHAVGKYKSGAWAFDATLLDSTSWSEAAQWADRQQLEGAGYVGGAAETRQMADILNDWLASYPCFRAYWTCAGTLALRVIELSYPAYRSAADPPLLRTEHEVETTFDYALNSGDITDSFTGSYLYDQVQSKYQSSLTVTDPTIGEQVSSNVQMQWSIRRSV